MTSQPNIDSLVSVAIEAALQGFFDVKDASGKPMILEDKGGCDACTYWDNHLEEVTKKLFQTKTPDITVFAEESKDREDSEWTRKQHKLWILDAIDGTPNFKDGLSQWGKAVAYLEDDECLINAIAIPSENAVYVAQRANKTVRIKLGIEDCVRPSDKNPLDPRMIQRRLVNWAIGQWDTRYSPLISKMATTPKTSNIQVGYDLGYVDRGQKLTHIVSRFADDKRIYYTPCIGSASYGLCAVASGRLGAYMIIGVDINDIYPGMLLVKEAGGVVSDQFGNPITRESGTLIASANEEVHRFLLDAIRPAAKNKEIVSIWKYRKAA